MPSHRPTEARMNTLVQKKEQIDAQIEALAQRGSVEKRKNEDRLVWLLGRLLRDSLADDPALQEWVRRELPSRLTDRDKKRGLLNQLFGENGEDVK